VEAIEAILQRRMIPRVGPDAPSREEIAELLELAVRAPNHHRTEPWRFHVLAGAERERLARVIEAEAIESGAEPARARDDAWAKVDRAPVIVVFTVIPSDDPKVVREEEFASVAMAMQNFLLGAYAKGLGAMLRTGTAAYNPIVREHLGLEPDEHVVGFVYLGYPAGERATTERVPGSEKTRWLGFDIA
jgi:nitroreductase